MECQICCDKFNKTKNKEVKCPSVDCNQSCCLSCFKRVLEDSEDNYPNCMFCRKRLSYNFIRSNTPLSWANKTYLEKRANQFLSQEKSLLPSTQEDVKIEIERRRRQKKIEELEKMKKELLRKFRDIDLEIYDLSMPIRLKEKEKTITSRTCSHGDCKGFLTPDWGCGICEKYTCSKCGEPKKSRNDEEHVCDPDIQSSFTLIRRDSRNCPKCSSLIHKTEGCNQMFCTQCGCMFDYRSGRLETGFFHNPHYFEALERGNVRVGARLVNACGLATPYEMIRLFQNWLTREKIPWSQHKFFKQFNDLYRLHNHIGEVTLEKFDNTQFNVTCKKLRVSYLLNEISEKDWLIKLKPIEKRKERNDENRQLIELFRDVARDILVNVSEALRQSQDNYDKHKYSDPENRFIIVIRGEETSTEKYLRTQIEEIQNIRNFCNSKFDQYGKLFNNIMPHIAENFETFSCRGI